jgi:hypothetical protein
MRHGGGRRLLSEIASPLPLSPIWSQSTRLLRAAPISLLRTYHFTQWKRNVAVYASAKPDPGTLGQYGWPFLYIYLFAWIAALVISYRPIFGKATLQG